MVIPASITLPAKLESLYTLMDFVSSCAREQGFADERISEIELAMEEVLVNIFNYAYKESGLDGNVKITCRSADARSLVIEIVDSGVPFDILSVHEPDLTAEIDQRPIGGLGIFFVKRFMDDIKYRREAEKNILTLIVKATENMS